VARSTSFLTINLYHFSYDPPAFKGISCYSLRTNIYHFSFDPPAFKGISCYTNLYHFCFELPEFKGTIWLIVYAPTSTTFLIELLAFKGMLVNSLRTLTINLYHFSYYPPAFKGIRWLTVYALAFPRNAKREYLSISIYKILNKVAR